MTKVRAEYSKNLRMAAASTIKMPVPYHEMPAPMYTAPVEGQPLSNQGLMQMTRQVVSPEPLPAAQKAQALSTLETQRAETRNSLLEADRLLSLAAEKGWLVDTQSSGNPLVDAAPSFDSESLKGEGLAAEAALDFISESETGDVEAFFLEGYTVLRSIVEAKAFSRGKTVIMTWRAHNHLKSIRQGVGHGVLPVDELDSEECQRPTLDRDQLATAFADSDTSDHPEDA